MERRARSARAHGPGRQSAPPTWPWFRTRRCSPAPETPRAHGVAGHLAHEQDHGRRILVRDVHARRRWAPGPRVTKQMPGWPGELVALRLGHHGRTTLLATHGYADVGIVQRIRARPGSFRRARKSCFTPWVMSCCTRIWPPVRGEGRSCSYQRYPDQKFRTGPGRARWMRCAGLLQIGGRCGVRNAEVWRQPSPAGHHGDMVLARSSRRKSRHRCAAACRPAWCGPARLRSWQGVERALGHTAARPGEALSAATTRSRRAWNCWQRSRTTSCGPVSAATATAWLMDEGAGRGLALHHGHGRNQRLWGLRHSQAPARHSVGFGDTVHRECAVAQTAHGSRRGKRGRRTGCVRRCRPPAATPAGGAPPPQHGAQLLRR